MGYRFSENVSVSTQRNCVSELLAYIRRNRAIGVLTRFSNNKVAPDKAPATIAHAISDFEVGMRVRHSKRGKGTVKDISTLRVAVLFDSEDTAHGYDKISLQTGKLQPMMNKSPPA
jgi:hypothetical protein